MLKSFLTMAICGTMFVSCTDGIGTGFGGNGMGKIAPTAEVDASVITKRSSRKEYSEVAPSDLSIKLISADGTYSRSWNSVAEFPTDQDFAVGQYRIEAYYGDESTEGFDAPYFYGAQEIMVKENEQTKVSLTATLANAMVDISYSDAFINYMTDYSAEVHSAGGAYTEYAASETRPVYTKAGNVDVAVSFTKPNGKGGKLEVANFTAEARHFYHINVDLAQGSGVVETIIVTIDESVEEETVKIDISDEVLNTSAPEVVAEGFTAGEAFSFCPGQTFENDMVFNIIARGGLKELVLTTQSASLLSKGWPSEIDLMSASTQQQNLLNNLGLTALGVFNKPDKLAVVNMTGVLGNISYLESGDNTNTFTLVAKDKYGKMSEPVSFVATAEAIQLAITNPILYVEGTELTLDLAFNGGNTNDIVFKYRNSGGTWTALPASFEALGNNQYKVTLTVAGGTNNIVLCAEYGTLVTPEITVERKPLVVPASAEVNAFATKAYLPVTIGAKDSDTQLLTQMMNNAQVVAVDNSRSETVLTAEADVTNKQFVISGLTPGKTYTVKIKNGDIDLATAPAKTFTTEAATQLQYSDMEEWEIVAGGSKYWWKSYLGPSSTTPWGTMNLVTTSEGGSGTNAFNHDGCAYVARSGTDRTDDKHSGTYAAVVKTIGWGYSDANGGMNAKHLTVGSLHLGSTPTSDGQSIDYGMSFSSRPSALKFWYKYVPRNSQDYGYAEIWVQDANGNVLTTANTNLNTVNSYTEKVLNLSYNTSAKAAKICVIFRSSNNPACQTISNDNLTKPSFANLSDGKYEGAILYLDDIELIY